MATIYDALFANAEPAVPQVQNGAAAMEQPQANPLEGLITQYSAATPEKKMAGVEALARDYPGGPEQLGIPNPAGEAIPGQPMASPKTTWQRFLDFTSENPQFMLDLGARLLAPRSTATSQASHIATGLNTAVGNLEARRAAARMEGRADKKLASDIELQKAQTGLTGARTDLTGAQTNLTGAQAGQTARETQSIPFKEDLMKAQAELARAQAAQATGKGAAQKDMVYNQMMGNLLFKNNPDKYASADDAAQRWAEFMVTKGKDPTSEALIALMENLPYMREDRIQPTIDLIQKQLDGVGGLQEGSVKKRTETEFRQMARQNGWPETAAEISAENWAAIKANPKKLEVAKQLYGANNIP